jgi:hypothetical protein
MYPRDTHNWPPSVTGNAVRPYRARYYLLWPVGLAVKVFRWVLYVLLLPIWAVLYVVTLGWLRQGNIV